MNPTPDKILSARKAAKLTQLEAAKLLHTTYRVWQQWEHGARKMHPAFFELFEIKSGLNPDYRLKKSKTKK